MHRVDQLGKLIEVLEYLSKYASETFRVDFCATTYLLTGLMDYVSERENGIHLTSSKALLTQEVQNASFKYTKIKKQLMIKAQIA
jgi:hypothetical protein